MKKEDILVIPKKTYLDNPLENIKDIISNHGLFYPREQAESDENYLQIIPYVVIRNRENIFMYERLKGTNEQRLHHMYSIGVGGHIPKSVRSEELQYIPHSNWLATELGAYDEVNEEVTFMHNDQIIDPQIIFTNHVIYDDTNEVGRVHLGILGICNVDSAEVIINEPDKLNGTFTSLQKVKATYSKLETWSQIALDKIKLL